jgi:signal transduction histidine kinase/DNA-binding response OmpR family regulator
VYARLLRSRDGRFWITGLNCSLVRFDTATGLFENFSYAGLFGEQAGSVQAFALAEDGNGILWIGTQLGLVRCKPGAGGFDFRLLRTDAANRQGLSNNSIACLLPDPADPSGILWVGTKGGGINRFDQRTGLFTHITTREGLPDNVIYGILPGDEAELWGSTNRGIFKLSLSTGASGSFAGDITTFTEAQGLQDNEFNTQAFFRASNGELLFGGVNGLNRFFPREVILDSMAPPVFLVGIQINHHPATFGEQQSHLEAPPEHLSRLVLNHDQNNLSFEFAALDFTHPPLNRYRYRLLGIDRQWVELGTSRFAHFTHLEPGSYTLMVQGSNGEGPWQDLARPLEIVIHPPWWRSAAAYALYLLLLLYAGWQIYRFQMRRMQMREQLAFEQRETERIRAMEEMKTNFFSNVTHEFRTPLTLILEPVRRILSGTKEPETRENALLVAANSQRLLGLVNQLLDMAKLESGNLRLDLRYDDFAETLRGVYRSFLPLAEQRGIRLSLNIESGTGTFLFDRDKVEQILNNLVSNALKFTPGGGSVTVRCSREQAGDNPPGMRIEVADTGIGIPADALGRIFDRFYQVDGETARAGTGIGLALSRELAMRMNGNIGVQSEPGKGSVFCFFLPLPENNIERAAPPPAADVETETQAPAPADAVANRQSLLLVEDNAELRHFIRKTLSENWDVAEASDGREGLAKAREILPDIIVSDVMMPEMDGYALCAELKNDELTAHIPVVLLTAKSAMDSKIRGLRTGADDYLTKPFNSGELLVRLESLAENRRLLRRKYSRLPAETIAGDEAQESAAMSPPDREFMRRFILLLEQNLSDETIGVEELAQRMFISRVQLYRKIKALTDRNVTDFVRDYRLDRAMAMLKNREGRVQEIAARVGFGSEKYFSRAFRDKFGVPPSRVV